MNYLKRLITGLLPIIITIIGVIAIHSGKWDDAPGAVFFGVILIVLAIILNTKLITL